MKPSLVMLRKAVYKALLFVVCLCLYANTSTFAQVVTTHLYFSDSAQLDRTDPVASVDLTTATSIALVPKAKYLYAFRGASKIDFWRYDIAANAWTAMATTPGTVSRGGALVSDGTNIYAIRGGTTDFWRYNIASNSWSSMAGLPALVNGGASLVYLNGAIYALRGTSTTTFWKYTIASNTWTAMATTPSPVDWGGALTTDGTNIYALKGLSTNTFWKYTVSSNSWSALASAPGPIAGGGSLGFDGTSIVALQGGNLNNLYKYDIGLNSWTTQTPAPSPVFKGGALASDDQNNYTLKGNASQNLWKFDGSAWSSLANTPSAIDSGGALVKFGTLPAKTTFTQSKQLCSDLVVKAGAINVISYVSVNYGTMPANPAITATIKYSSGTLITLSNPVYNSSAGTLTWTGTLASDVTIPATDSLALDISTSQQGVSFSILYDSQAKPSEINFQTSTYTDISSLDVYNAPYPTGSIVANVIAGYSRYIRATVTNPFGSDDINSLDLTVTPPGSSLTPALVNSTACAKIFETNWVVPGAGTDFTIDATAKQGLENTVTSNKSTVISICTACPPDANIDRVIGNGGEPLEIDVLANDTDPNNDLNPSSLSVITQPNNGNVIIDNNKITYLPNGTFDGNDTLTYEICDYNYGGIPMCSQTQVIITILPITFNPCTDAGSPKTYYMPFAEDQAFLALQRSGSPAIPSTNVRTIISMKISYPGMKLIWDHWEDGYETDILNPTQSTTKVWGDSNIYNGIAPGYPNDIIPTGASIVLDNTMPTPRVAGNIFYDGKDKLYSSGQLSVTQVCGEPSIIAVQCMKTNVTSYPTEFGKSFTLPVGQDLPSQDFKYTSLFIRAGEDNTTVQVDRDNDGAYDVTLTLNQGQVVMIDENTAPAGTKIKAGAVVTSDKPVGVDAHFGGVDNYSCREVPVFPATWYSYTYYTPVPTTGPATAPYDTAVVMLYNSLSRDININYSSGIPSSGTILLKANSSVRFPMPLTATGAFKFYNPTKESFVAFEIYDSYTPGGGGNSGSTRDWAFNLISEARLTDFASVAWAPGSTDGTRNDNPIWVTPNANTIVYVKYDGDVLHGPSTSPCGLKYDVAIPLNTLQYTKIKDPSDKDQSGTALYTCNGAKIAAVYGEDAATALAANPSWDVGSTIQPFCKQKLIVANDDWAVTLVNTPVTIPILNNDRGFLAVINPGSVTTANLLQPSHGTVKVNANGTVIYIPNTGYVGKDTFQYNVCSTPYPIVCASAYVYVTISSCPTPNGQNLITGQAFLDKNGDGIKNDGGTGFTPAKVYLYVDGNCNGSINANELVDSADVDINGYYQFIKAPEKITADNFDLPTGGNSCASGTDGTVAWKNNWLDNNDPSSGFCVSPAQSAANTDVEIVKDSTFSYALRLDDANRSAYREFNIQNATQAFVSFKYRSGTTNFTLGENILVQLSSDNSTYNTIYTIAGNNKYNSNYIEVSNIPVNVASYNGSNKIFIRFLTDNNVDEGDLVYIDDVEIKFLQYNQCYIVALNTAGLPTYATPTTATSKTITFNNAGTCSGVMDFGVKRILTYAVNDENSTWQDVNVSGLVKQNDFDQEGNTQTFTTFLNPSGMAVLSSGSNIRGTDKTGATVVNAGKLTYNATGDYTFDPMPNFLGTVNIPYKICDNGSPSACDTAYLMITVDPLPANGNSVIANNDEDISYGGVISNNLLVNDQDPKNYSFTVTLLSYDSNGDGIADVTTLPGTMVIVAGTDIGGKPVANAGTLLVESDGTYTYTPADSFVGTVKAIYTITDASNAVAVANLQIDVLADINGIQNDPPFAGDDFGYTTVDQPTSGYFIVNDREPNADTVTMKGVKIDMSGSLSLIGTPVATTKGGSVKFYSNGIYEYTPPAGYVGPDLVTYSICDVTTNTPQPLCANALIHFLIAPGITISGKVWDDANGDVIDQGASEPETNIGGLLYVTLVNELGYVVSSVAVAADGTYSFTSVSPGKNYSLILTTTKTAAGDLAPSPSLPADWINTGETRNGTIDYGTMGVIDDRTYDYTDAIHYDFGIERTPTSVPFYVTIAPPYVGQQLVLNGGSNPPILSGKDGEDCPSGCMLNGKTLSIDIPPLNSNLYYGGALVTPGLVINNFDPNQLKVEFTAITVASTITNFYYSFIDAAGKKDSVPAIYSITWFKVLPAKGLTLTANRTNNTVALEWKTISEINSDYFEVERSTDAKNYTAIGTRVKAAGSSNNERSYQLTDNIADLQSTTVYYRVKLTDIGGKIAYSNVAIVKLPAIGSIKVSPNPFVSDITVSLPTDQNTVVSIRMMDISGRAVLNTTKKVSKDSPQVTLNNLNGLLKGIYVLEVIDLQSGKKYVTKMEKSNL